VNRARGTVVLYPALAPVGRAPEPERALLINGAARARLAGANLQAPDLIDAEVLSVLR
jgi:hypothetical protein